MKSSIKRKWVEALRSGNYEQGTNSLRDEGRYCCLGVLCDVAGPTDWDRNVEDDYGDDEVVWYEYDNEAEVLSSKMLEYFDLSEDQQQTLYQMNDGVRDQHGDPDPVTKQKPWKIRSHTFSEIADYIESNL